MLSNNQRKLKGLPKMGHGFKPKQTYRAFLPLNHQNAPLINQIKALNPDAYWSRKHRYLELPIGRSSNITIVGTDNLAEVEPSDEKRIILLFKNMNWLNVPAPADVDEVSK